MTGKNIVHHAIGRLVAGRVVSMKTRAEAIEYCNAFRVAVKGCTARVAIFADYRLVSVFSPDVADELQTLMKDMNPYVDRSAVLVASEHSTIYFKWSAWCAKHSSLRDGGSPTWRKRGPGSAKCSRSPNDAIWSSSSRAERDVLWVKLALQWLPIPARPLPDDDRIERIARFFSALSLCHL